MYQLQYLEEKVVPENHVLVVLEKTTLAVTGFEGGGFRNLIGASKVGCNRP
jgi:hypothetical protein